jgi:hypothetical protein
MLFICSPRFMATAARQNAAMIETKAQAAWPRNFFMN